jgi:hypothetical protein
MTPTTCSPPLLWVSRSLRHLVKALSVKGFQGSQRIVVNLLRDLKYSCQANQKTREGGNPPGSRRSVRAYQPRSQCRDRRGRAGDFR